MNLYTSPHTWSSLNIFCVYSMCLPHPHWNMSSSLFRHFCWKPSLLSILIALCLFLAFQEFDVSHSKLDLFLFSWPEIALHFLGGKAETSSMECKIKLKLWLIIYPLIVCAVAFLKFQNSVTYLNISYICAFAHSIPYTGEVFPSFIPPS